MSIKSPPSGSPDVLDRLLKRREEQETKDLITSAKKEFEDTINAMTKEEINETFFNVNINNDFDLEAETTPPLSTIKLPVNQDETLFQEVDLTMDDDSISSNGHHFMKNVWWIHPMIL